MPTSPLPPSTTPVAARLDLTRSTTAACLVGLLTTFLVSAGCYRRVVGVSGDDGSYEGKVYEPNLKDGESNVVEDLFQTRTVRTVESP